VEVPVVLVEDHRKVAPAPARAALALLGKDMLAGLLLELALNMAEAEAVAQVRLGLTEQATLVVTAVLGWLRQFLAHKFFMLVEAEAVYIKRPMAV
jgi:hypothetical protein